MNNLQEKKFAFFKDLESATGEIPFGLTNDYMFRAVLQKYPKVLRGLVASLLDLADDDIRTIEIKNEIIPGETIDDKEYRLDVNVLLNSTRHINLEMQVVDLHNWENRSLSYLCRAFDQLTRGREYSEIEPVIHIGILDYTLFTEYPEFYAKYRMINVEKNYIYNDNFILNVLDLNQIDIATDNDRACKRDYWARLFKAKTWEELKKMTTQNEYIEEAVNAIFNMNASEEIRKRCRDREDYYADLRGMEKDKQRMKQEVEKMRLEAEEMQREVEEMQREAEEMKHEAEEIKHEAEEIKHEAEEIKHEAEEMKHEHDQLQLEYNQKKAENDQLKLEYDKKQAENDQLKLEVERLKEQLKHM